MKRIYDIVQVQVVHDFLSLNVHDVQVVFGGVEELRFEEKLSSLQVTLSDVHLQVHVLDAQTLGRHHVVEVEDPLLAGHEDVSPHPPPQHFRRDLRVEPRVPLQLDVVQVDLRETDAPALERGGLEDVDEDQRLARVPLEHDAV